MCLNEQAVMDFVRFHSQVAKLHAAGTIPMKARFERQILGGHVMERMAKNFLGKMYSMHSFWKTEYLSRYFLVCICLVQLLITLILFHTKDSHKRCSLFPLPITFLWSLRLHRLTLFNSGAFELKSPLFYSPFLTHPLSLSSLFSLRTNEKLRCVLLCVLFCV
jgi:hypothetical protein